MAPTAAENVVVPPPLVLTVSARGVAFASESTVDENETPDPLTITSAESVTASPNESVPDVVTLPLRTVDPPASVARLDNACKPPTAALNVVVPPVLTVRLEVVPTIPSSLTVLWNVIAPEPVLVRTASADRITASLYI